MADHLPTCALTQARPCPAGQSLHSELPEEHWWSGWPGAVCLKCGDEDAREKCLAGCDCPCHDLFWMSVEEASRG